MQQTSQTNQKSSSKAKDQNSDIIEFILEDHKPLKEFIEIMKDSEKYSLEERFQAFEDFAPALIAHAKPEEETLYTYMKKDEELREHGFEGEAEHQIADQLVEEIKRVTDPDKRSAKIKVLAELVEHHIEEEEDELLPDFKKESEASIRTKLGNEFMELKIKYLAAGSDNIIPDPKAKNSRDLPH